ncbi:MAG: response regulator, partial [bacterium]
KIGKGSVFHFTAQFGIAENTKSQMPASLDDMKDMRVLIVDDNATNRLIYGEVTTSWGMLPTVAESGAEALQLAENAINDSKPFTMILLDRQMPEMDGYQLAAAIRTKPNFLKPIMIMLTSTGDMGDVERRKELGIAACLVKPVRQSDLLNAMMLAMGIATNERNKAIDTPTVRSLKILLAEDYLMNQELAVHFLERRGHTVIVVENGAEALRKLEQEDFDVVLMDVQMPIMDGFTATAAIRDPQSKVCRHDIPIIAMTAHAMKSDRERCLSAGMDGYVSKPFTAASLVGALVELFGEELHDGEKKQKKPQNTDVFDSAALLERMEGDMELSKKMAIRFLESAPELLTKIEDSLVIGDAEACAINAHTLKGAAATMGGHHAKQACLRLEMIVRTGDVQAGRELISIVRREVGELESALRDFFEIKKEKTSQTASNKIVDINVLKSLVGDDPTVIHDFLHDYLLSAKKTAEELRNAVFANDCGAAEGAAHRLKSSSLSVGAKDFGELCSLIEVAGMDGNIEKLVALLPKFENEFVAVNTFIRAMMG